MSILPLTNYLRLGLSFFKLPRVRIHDVGYEKISGQDTVVGFGYRNIKAAIDPSAAKQLEKIFGGDVSDGDLAIYTDSDVVLHILDQTDGVGPDNRDQSYLQYKGVWYRIMNIADWSDQGGVFVYQGRRHAEQHFV